MEKYEVIELLKEEIHFSEELLEKYMYYFKHHIYNKCKTLCVNEQIFIDSDELEDLVFDTELELYKALKKFKGKTFSELLSFSHITTDRYISEILKPIKKKLRIVSVFYHKDIENSDSTKCIDNLSCKPYEILEDSIEKHIIYDPIPKEVKETLKPEHKEILDIILHFREFPLKYYAQLKHISKDAARKRKERFSKSLAKKMIQWKTLHPEEANLIPEVFYYCKQKIG
ncbi:hypothetical protein [Clostridium peptidivorans]|uniref:hypothetical protein n=1 Tax=Clostridium peptidivorans TaxID=100174 RepID=UPI000BE308AB|nr:hypothetical protein [Clostridium peptidivorans]